MNIKKFQFNNLYRAISMAQTYYKELVIKAEHSQDPDMWEIANEYRDYIQDLENMLQVVESSLQENFAIKIV